MLQIINFYFKMGWFHIPFRAEVSVADSDNKSLNNEGIENQSYLLLTRYQLQFQKYKIS